MPIRAGMPCPASASTRAVQPVTATPTPISASSARLRAMLAGKPGRFVNGTCHRLLNAFCPASARPRAPTNATTRPIDERDAGPVQAVHVGPELVADHREVGKAGVEDPLLQVRVVGQGDPQDADQHQQEREHGQEGVVRQQGGVLTGLVLAVLAQHGQRQRDPSVLALVGVEPSHQPRGRLAPLGRPVRRRAHWRSVLRHRRNETGAARPAQRDRRSETGAR